MRYAHHVERRRARMGESEVSGKQKIKVICYGLGSIGCSVAKYVLDNPELEIVAAIDKDQEKVDKDLGSLTGSRNKTGIKVSCDPNKVFRNTKANVVLHTTSSSFEEVHSQIQGIILAGMNCVSSTEELFFPTLRYPELSHQLDDLAKQHGVTVLGTGVNPGFAMDVLPIFVTKVCQKVEKIKVERIVDASTRRLPLQRKIGASLTLEEFHKEVKEKKVGHVGLVESLAFIAQNLGWELDDIKEEINPVIAEVDLTTQFFTVKKGKVAGLVQIVRGIRRGKEVVTLDLQMYVGASDPHDSVTIEGKPTIELCIPKGLPGDSATVAMLVNSIPWTMKARPGLVNVETCAQVITSTWKRDL